MLISINVNIMHKIDIFSPFRRRIRIQRCLLAPRPSFPSSNRAILRFLRSIFENVFDIGAFSTFPCVFVGFLCALLLVFAHKRPQNGLARVCRCEIRIQRHLFVQKTGFIVEIGAFLRILWPFLRGSDKKWIF